MCVCGVCVCVCVSEFVCVVDRDACIDKSIIFVCLFLIQLISGGGVRFIFSHACALKHLFFDRKKGFKNSPK